MNSAEACSRGVAALIAAAIALVLGAAAALVPASAMAASCSSIANSAWNVQTTWGPAGTGCLGAAAGGIPGATDNVTINNGHNVSLIAARTVLSLTINTGGTVTTGSFGLTVAAGAGILKVDGNIAGNGNAASVITKLSTGNLSGTGTLTNLQNLTITGDTTIPAGTSLTFTGAECLMVLSANVDVINNGTVNFATGGNCGTSRQITFTNPSSFTNNNTLTAGTIALSTNGVFTNVGTVPVPASVSAAAITGVDATSVWNNNANSTLTIAGAMNTAGTLNAGTNPNTVDYNGAAQAIKLPSSGNYYNLSLSGSGNKTPAAGTYNILAKLTVNTGVTMQSNTNDPDIVVSGDMQLDGTYTASATAARTLSIGGDFTMSGTLTGNASSMSLKGDFTKTAGAFNAGAGTFTFNSTTADQTVASNAALSFQSLQINNTGTGKSVILSQDVSVTTLLTLTAGVVKTGANTLIDSGANCTTSITRTGGWVNGNLRLTIPNTNPVTCTFHVGDANNYSPITITKTGANTGTLTGSSTAGDHPSIASSGIDSGNSVNRYWTLTGGTLAASTPYSAILKFCSATGTDCGVNDVDGTAVIANFIVEQWDGTNWYSTTLSGCATTTPTTQCTITGESAFRDFAIGDSLSGFNGNPGAFNVFETTASTTQILGRIFTKLAGTTIPLSIVAVSNNARNAAPSTNTLTVSVVDASSGGALTASTNCPSPVTNWPVIQTQTVNSVVGWTSGRVNVTLTAPTQAVKNARILVSQNAGAIVGCSTDNFAIRPAVFNISSTANNNSSGAGTTVKTGANFSMTATAVRSDLATAITAGYTGTPVITPPVIISAPLTAVGTLSGSLSAATGAAATGSTFTYSEVGNFGLSANAVSDTSFTLVDQASDCVSGSFSNTLAGGQYGCSIGSTAVPQTTGSSGFGRFIPDHFALSAGTLSTRSDVLPACSPASTFTYMGEDMGLGFTLTAQNSSNVTTQNYAGSYAKLALGTFTNLNMGAISGATNLTTRIFAGSTSSGSWTAGAANVTITTRINRNATPDGNYAALNFGIAPVDSDSVAVSPLDLNVGGSLDHRNIGISTDVRFGRLRILGAVGSEETQLPVPLQTEYWSTTGFVVNTADSCTTLAQANIAQGNYQKSLAACQTVVSLPPVTFASGIGKLVLTKPGTGNVGSVDLSPQLGSSIVVGSKYCATAGGSEAAATAASQSYLQGAWNGVATYDQNPTGRAAFGYFGAQPKSYIFLRENY